MKILVVLCITNWTSLKGLCKCFLCPRNYVQIKLLELLNACPICLTLHIFKTLCRIYFIFQLINRVVSTNLHSAFPESGYDSLFSGMWDFWDFLVGRRCARLFQNLCSRFLTILLGVLMKTIIQLELVRFLPSFI